MTIDFRSFPLPLLTAVQIGVFLVSISLSANNLLAQDFAEQKAWQANMAAINLKVPKSFKIDEKAVRAAGIAKQSGKHIVLYTDVRDAKVGELISVFDKAFPQWCQLFDVNPKRADRWKMRVFLIANSKNTQRFKKSGLIPDDLPEFLAGYQRGPDIWLYLQPGDYYTSHLLIHEGTHAMMQWFLDGHGAPWYSEGMAELIGVHRWSDNTLKLNYRLQNRDEAPYWGRVKQIKDDWKTGQGMTLSDVLAIQPRAFLKVRAYSWSWAACDFFSNHSRTKELFPKVQKLTPLRPSVFNQKFRELMEPHWNELERDWALYISEMEYGYAVERGQISPAKRSNDETARFSIQSDRSWQLTDIKFEKGDRIEISSSGEFRVGQTEGSLDGSAPVAWPCQSNGITIDYYRGHPLGMLHAGLLNAEDNTPKDQIAGLINPVPIGVSSQFTAPHDGILCLRINESPASLDDNQGALEVRVEKLE